MNEVIIEELAIIRLLLIALLFVISSISAGIERSARTSYFFLEYQGSHSSYGYGSLGGRHGQGWTLPSTVEAI